MRNKEFSSQLEKRTKRYAIEIIRLSASLPSSWEINVIRAQLTKSGTSVGANYREANRSRSKADFYNKIKICESEASETVFWIEVIEDVVKELPERVIPLKQEAIELLAIFTSIGKSSRN